MKDGMPKASVEAERVDKMFREGKISADERRRLQSALDAHAKKEAVFIPDKTAWKGNFRRMLKVCGWCAAFLIVGVVLGWCFSPEGAAGRAASSTYIESSAGGGAERPIDLNQLANERRLNMKTSRVVALIILVCGIIAVTGASAFFIYNRMIDGREAVNASWAQVENVYQRRLDLIPALVDAVKSYMKHEHDTLSQLTEARAKALGIAEATRGRLPSAQELEAVDNAQGQVRAALGKLFALVENYPDLKASQNILAFQDQLEGSENRIAMERRVYNESARQYNALIQRFPALLFADLFGFEGKAYFRAEGDALRAQHHPFSSPQ